MLLNDTVTCRSRQRGVVMFIALIALVMMTLTGIALLRTVDAGTLVAGNMAMKTSAMRLGDTGLQAAANWLYNANATNPASLAANGSAGYSASGLNDDQMNCASTTWTACWEALSGLYAPVSVTSGIPNGYAVQYIIQRMCDAFGRCAQSPQMYDPTNRDNRQRLMGGGATYYRITVRVSGPRNTVSLLQGVVVP